MKRFLAVALAATSTLAVVLGASPLARAEGESKQVARGRYLVTIAGCNDCHTPLKMGRNGPELDLSRMLSGHPESLEMPPAPKLAMPWGAAFAATMTAASGPWGTSFAANLTPHETGIGPWTEKDFLQTVRSGRHLGRGRPILPPMPIQNVAQMTDEDLKAVFAYLRSIPAVKNEVPQPLPPALASN